MTPISFRYGRFLWCGVTYYDHKYDYRYDEYLRGVGGMITQERRSSERVPTGFKAELILNEKIYEVSIENLSKNSLKVRTVTTNTAAAFLTNSELNLEFQMPSGERVNLNCMVIWSRKNSSRSLIVDLGVWIDESSPQYEEYYTTICMDYMLMVLDGCHC